MGCILILLALAVLAFFGIISTGVVVFAAKAVLLLVLSPVIVVAIWLVILAVVWLVEAVCK